MNDSGLPWCHHLRPTLDELEIYDVPPAEAAARMHANECPEPWPAAAMKALGEVLEAIELGRYPDTSGRELRRVLSERYGCDPERIVLGNGSDEIIALLLTALSGSGAAVVIPVPTFVMYRHTARVFGLEVREVPVDDAFQLRPEAMRAALEDAGVCFIARPNNPTGALFDAAVIQDLVARHRDTVFVIDEAYAAYAPGQSLWRPDLPPNVVYMSTLSKVGLAALRIGYCIAHPVLAEALNKVRHPYNISRTSLALAQTLLTRFADVQDAMVRRTIENRERLRAILSGIPGATVYPSAANLVLVRLATDEQASSICEHLASQSVLIKNVSSVPGLERCIRVSVGTREDLDRLAAGLVGWSSQG